MKILTLLGNYIFVNQRTWRWSFCSPIWNISYKVEQKFWIKILKTMNLGYTFFQFDGLVKKICGNLENLKNYFKIAIFEPCQKSQITRSDKKLHWPVAITNCDSTYKLDSDDRTSALAEWFIGCVSAIFLPRVFLSATRFRRSLMFKQIFASKFLQNARQSRSVWAKQWKWNGLKSLALSRRS